MMQATNDRTRNDRAGPLPKTSAGHNPMLLKLSDQIAECLERAANAEKSGQCAADQSAEPHHQPEGSSDSLSLAKRVKFPIGTAVKSQLDAFGQLSASAAPCETAGGRALAYDSSTCSSTVRPNSQSGVAPGAIDDVSFARDRQKMPASEQSGIQLARDRQHQTL